MQVHELPHWEFPTYSEMQISFVKFLNHTFCFILIITCIDQFATMPIPTGRWHTTESMSSLPQCIHVHVNINVGTPIKLTRHHWNDFYHYVIPIMTNYNLLNTQSIKTKHTTLSRNLTKLTFKCICCSRICVDMGSMATYGCPLSTQTSTGSTAYPCCPGSFKSLDLG